MWFILNIFTGSVCFFSIYKIRGAVAKHIASILSEIISKLYHKYIEV